MVERAAEDPPLRRPGTVLAPAVAGGGGAVEVVGGGGAGAAGSPAWRVLEVKTAAGSYVPP